MIPRNEHISSGQHALSRRILLTLCLIMAGITAGCATTEKVEDSLKAESEIYWPKPPDAPRIRYVKSVTGPEDLGIKKGFFRKLVEFFAGREEEGFAKPYGVTVDGAGRIYVSDSGDSSYHVLDPTDGKYLRVDQFKEEKLRSPIGIAVDRNGNVYVSDSELKKVYCFDKAGKGVRSFGAQDLKRPAGVFVDGRDGLLYVVDTLGHRVVVYDLLGNKKLEFGERGNEDGQMNFPTNVWVDQNGTILVCDSMNFRVQMFGKAGRFIGKFGQEGNRIGTFSKPKGVAVDTEGHIYVVEALFDAVQIFDQQGQVLLSFGRTGQDKGEFWLPAGIWIDSHDRIYVVDSYNQRIQIFQYMRRG